MGLRIGTNVAAISAARNLSRNSEQLEHSLKALASGSRIVKAGDDAAALAISESLRGQERSLIQARQNAANAIGLIQVAEGGLNEQNNILIRLREIAIQAASDTVGDEERGYLNTEFSQLTSELDRIAQTTRFGQKQLLVGSGQEYEFFLGTGGVVDGSSSGSKSSNSLDVIKYKLDTNTRSSSLGINKLQVTDKDDAQDSLETIDDALKLIAKARAGFGAMQGRLEIAGNNLEIQQENIAEARSRISDTDVATEVSKLARSRVLQEFGIAVLAQANMGPERVLRLLQ